MTNAVIADPINTIAFLFLRDPLMSVCLACTPRLPRGPLRKRPQEVFTDSFQVNHPVFDPFRLHDGQKRERYQGRQEEDGTDQKTEAAPPFATGIC